MNHEHRSQRLLLSTCLKSGGTQDGSLTCMGQRQYTQKHAAKELDVKHPSGQRPMMTRILQSTCCRHRSGWRDMIGSAGKRLKYANEKKSRMILEALHLATSLKDMDYRMTHL